jgi:hypothetical protein
MWTCAHVDMEERFDRGDVRSGGLMRISKGRLASEQFLKGARDPKCMCSCEHVGMDERFAPMAAIGC